MRRSAGARTAWGGALLLALVGSAAAEPSVALVALGEVMPARAMAARLDRHGAGWVWAGVRPLLAAADLRCANLECAVTERGERLGQPYAFRVPPGRAAAVLRAGGLEVVSNANNHAFDYGAVGLADTLAALDRGGVVGLGAGVDRPAAIRPRLVERRGLRIAFVGYTAWTGHGYAPDELALATLDEATWADEIAAAATVGDVLVVSVHWGLEGTTVVTATQRRLAHAAIDAGADLILGHGPHLAQEIEVYRDRPIAYSLGNAVFDRDDPRQSNGLLLAARLGPDSAVVTGRTRLRLVDGRPLPQQDSPPAARTAPAE